MDDKELRINGSGYYDPTAYKAIKNIETERFHDLLDDIYDLCRSRGFSIVGHVILKDEQTGRVWR